MANPLDEWLGTPQPKDNAAADSIMTLKSERNKPYYNQGDVDALEREIQYASKQAGVPYDGGPTAPAQKVVHLNDAPTTQPSANPLDTLLPGAGGGRGSINPPSVGQPQPGNVNPNLTTADLGGAREKLTGAGVQGATHGFTAGTFDYLPAGMAYAYDRIQKKLSGDTTKPYSFDELLAAQRAQRNDVAAASPKTYSLSDTGGSIALGTLTGGESIPATIAAQSAQGAVRKYTESPDTTLTDAAKAGTVEGATAGAVSLIGKVAGAVAGSAADKVMLRQMTSRNTNIERANKNALSDFQNMNPALRKAEGTVAPEQVPLFTLDSYKTAQAAKPITEVTAQRFRPTVNTLSSLTLPTLATGGAYYLAEQNPDIIDPKLAAALAGTTTLAATKGKAMILGTKAAAAAAANLANKYPGAAQAAGNALMPTAGAVGAQMETPAPKKAEVNPLDEWLGSPQ